MSLTAGRSTVIVCGFPPEVWIRGSATPSWSTRSRMMSTARARASWVTFGVCGHGLGREVVLGVDVDRFALHPDLPFERGADMVGAVLELQAQHLVDRASDHLLGLQPRQLERAPAAVDDPAVGVAGEERRIRSR